VKPEPEQVLREVANNLDFIWSRWDGIMGAVTKNQQMSQRIYDAGDDTLVRINVTVTSKAPHQRARV
jgi:hypothetical protein